MTRTVGNLTSFSTILKQQNIERRGLFVPVSFR